MTWGLAVAGLYLGVGLVFALVFVVRGVQQIDRHAVGGSWGFRLAILPAAATLWPILLRRWLRRSPPPEERNAHRELAGERGSE